MRITVATCTSTPERSGSTMGSGCVRIGSGSSSSNDVRQRRQRLLTVLNWTRWQWSHLTTSRFSTGARVVAIQVLGVPEQAPDSNHKTYLTVSWLELRRTLRYCSARVKSIGGRKQVKAV